MQNTVCKSCGDDILHLCTMQRVSDAFQGVAAPLTLVLMVDILTSTIYLAIEAFNCQALAALIFLAIAIVIMLLWTFQTGGAAPPSFLLVVQRNQ